jgi:hypothetical protein
MRSYPKINPADAAARGLKPIKAQRVGQVLNLKGMTQEAESYAAAIGKRIVAMSEDYVDKRVNRAGNGLETIHTRTFWCA